MTIPTSSPDDGPRLNAEQAYVGSLLWLDLPAAEKACRWLQSADIASPWIQLVHELVEQLCDAGVQPDPVAVLSLAISEQRVTGEHRIHILTRVLWTLFDHRATVPASVRWYAAQALDEAVRRRTIEMTVRVAQVAEHADPEELERLTLAEQTAVEQVRARHRAVSQLDGPRLVTAA